MPGADWSIFASARAGHGKCMSRIATLGAQLPLSCNISNPSLFTTLLAWVWLTKAQVSATTPQMRHQAHFTSSTSWPNPTYGPQWPLSPTLPPLAGEEGTGEEFVLQQLSHPGQGAGVCDGAAHLRVHKFNKLLNMMVTLLGPCRVQDPRHSPVRRGGGGGGHVG